MNNAPVGLTEFGFWLALAIVIVAIIWAGVKKQQMKHELTLKLLEKGKDVDQELLAKLLATDKPAQEKSPVERRRAERGAYIMVSLFSGVLLAFMGIMMHGNIMQPVEGTAGQGRLPMMTMMSTGPNWLIVGLGVFVFVFGCLFWLHANREYKRAKAEEKQSQD